MDQAIQSSSGPTAGALAGLQTIGEVARRFGITLRALRFYEDRGLVKPLRHGSSRFYDKVSCERLEAILYGKRLGLSLNEIAHRLANPANDGGRPMVAAQETEVSREIARLEAKRSTIDDAIGALRCVLSQIENRNVSSYPAS